MMFQVQVRTEEGDLRYYPTLTEAFQAAQEDSRIWKISFSTETAERVRLVRRGDSWVYEAVLDGATH